jgi:O-methyltransferase involved in polyketide biosynthesis
VPPNLHFAPVDFTHEDLGGELGRSGLRSDVPTFFSWLGVVPYLEPPAVRATLATAARLSGGSGGIVFDFIAPPPRWHVPFRVMLWLRGRQVARLGEPFRAPMRPADARRWLLDAGFEDVTIHHPRDLNARYLSDRTDGLRVSPLTYIAVARARRSLAYEVSAATSTGRTAS